MHRSDNVGFCRSADSVLKGREECLLAVFVVLMMAYFLNGASRRESNKDEAEL